MVGHGYDFRLKLHPGKWKEGKSGTIRITFRNVMHTVADEEFPFYRTIDLQMVSKPNLTQLPGNLFSIFIRFGLIIGDIITELTKVWGDWKI